jgi:hypothetical protein
MGLVTQLNRRDKLTLVIDKPFNVMEDICVLASSLCRALGFIATTKVVDLPGMQYKWYLLVRQRLSVVVSCHSPSTYAKKGLDPFDKFVTSMSFKCV